MNIEQVNKSLCTGCGACKEVCPFKAIDLKFNKEGFLEPVINRKKCIDCGLCYSVCLCTEHNDVTNPVQRVFAVKHKENAVRKKSQSGGAFMALAEYILSIGGYVYGAALDKEFKTRHICVDNVDDLKHLQGTKYVQSELGDTFGEIIYKLSQNKTVLFTGLPCQVCGLKKLIKAKKINDEKLYTCDLICFGVPSPKIFEEWLNLLKKTYKAHLTEVRFRDVDDAWGKGTEKYIFDSGLVKKGSCYTELYFNHLIDRTSCSNCNFSSMERAGDITIGDFWGIEEFLPEFTDDKGVSAILVNNDKGSKLFSESAGNMLFIESTKEAVTKEQSRLQGQTYKYNKNRKVFWNKYRRFGLKFIMQEREYIPIDTSYKILRRVNSVINKLFNQ